LKNHIKTLISYYTGGALGSALPGYAYGAYGWAGVVACSVAAFALAMLANATLCGVPPRKVSARPSAS